MLKHHGRVCCAGGPATHAAFEGDIAALDALRSAGCDLRQRSEWLLQDEPRFSLVHAAAFNGQLEVLKYLREYMPPSFFRETDATGSNPLHTLLESSRDMATARFLLDQGVDGFAINSLGRSPLSMAIEALPELALELLGAKSRFEYRWWGDDLYWYSFSGIVLPEQRAVGSRSSTSAAAAPPAAAASTATLSLPLQFNDQNGQPASIEQLILRHERKELLETPVMLDLIERKWASFATAMYQRRIATFSLMTLSVFVLSVGESGSVVSYLAAAATAVAWLQYLTVDRKGTVRRFKGSFFQVRAIATHPHAAPKISTACTRGMAQTIPCERGPEISRDLAEPIPTRGRWMSRRPQALDIYNVALVPIVAGFRFGEDTGLFAPLPQEAAAVLASLSGVLQVSPISRGHR